MWTVRKPGERIWTVWKSGEEIESGQSGNQSRARTHEGERRARAEESSVGEHSANFRESRHERGRDVRDNSTKRQRRLKTRRFDRQGGGTPVAISRDACSDNLSERSPRRPHDAKDAIRRDGLDEVGETAPSVSPLPGNRRIDTPSASAGRARRLCRGTIRIAR